MAIFEELDVKTMQAFGGCTKCYGKGYSTQMDPGGSGEVNMNTCVCSRGKDLDKLLADLQKASLTKFVQEMEDNLPEYIDEFYPKKKDKERGDAIVHITEFLQEVKKALGV